MNIKKILAIACVAFGSAAAKAQLPMELQTPELVSINRMPMRADAFAFENKALATQFNREQSANYFSLNGNWKFNWVKDPNQRPEKFYEEGYDDSQWKTFQIPASWEVNGYGLPIYVNQPYDFAGHNNRYSKMNPPYDIPANNNPVGSYRRKINIPANFNGKQVFLHIGNAKSCVFVWVNGKKVGYSEDSKLAAEFNVTPYLKAGENTFAFQVYRWSDASYLECQDMFRFSGIERDVFLYSTNTLNVRDITIDATLNNSYTNGLLAVIAEVNNYKIEKGRGLSQKDTCFVDVELVDKNGTTVYKQEAQKATLVLGMYKAVANFNTEIKNVQTWTAETPYLYTLYVTLKNSKGEVLEVVPQKVGFKKIEIKGSDFLVNGKRVFIKGVNRHEHNATKGHTLSKEDMRKDMEMMKKLNVNAVRHSHYPPDPYWLQLCDEYGLYVVDEANIESHGLGYDLGTTLANKPLWKEAHLQRIQRMYERDKNHAAVVTWSLGNEAGDGSNFYAAYDWLRAKTALPIQYERDIDYGASSKSNYSEIWCPQYVDPAGTARYATNPKHTLPHIQSEYAHIMGNSLGNFKDYWDIIENTPKNQGGFIWEWIDQSIDTVKNGKRIKAYGGDFPLEGPVDENLSDNNFCVKGVVDAHRNMTPMSYEVKKVYQHIKTKYLGNKVIEVKNAYFFRDISNMELQWKLIENGVAVEAGIISNLIMQPQEKSTFTLPIKKAMAANKEYYLNVTYVLKAEETFMPKGYDIAAEQFEIQKQAITGITPKAGKLTLTDGEIATLKGNGFSVVIDKKLGIIKEVKKGSETVLQQGPTPAFYRAPTDNDYGAGFEKSFRMWRKAYTESKDAATTTITAQADGSYVISFAKNIVDGDAVHTQTVTIYGNGSLKVVNKFNPIKGKHKALYRAGNDLVLAKDYANIQFYGRGPIENYWDRKDNSFVGVYNQKVNEQYYPYARPQESGNKTDVRWVSFANAKGKKITFTAADSLLNFTAIPYSIDDLDPDNKKHQFHSGELVERNETYLKIDLQQMGLQGIDTWGSWPLEKYRIPYKAYEYSYWISL